MTIKTISICDFCGCEKSQDKVQSLKDIIIRKIDNSILVDLHICNTCITRIASMTIQGKKVVIRPHCPDCKGTGVVKVEDGNEFHNHYTEVKCTTCDLWKQ